MHKLGDVASSEALIAELYIDLKRRVNAWAAITKQTAQARMGYVGQHLVSIATGYPGGRSGARGKDIVMPDGEYAEVKTCYRVDQLGSCGNCGSVVASIELKCHACGSTAIIRKDDSKWLIGIRNETEYDEIVDPKWYYLVLFEFEDLNTPETIVASIWQVNPRSPGFAYAMVDYKENIKSRSASGAPFNLWPHSLKFNLMRPCLIYRSFIYRDDTIKTETFPGRDRPREETMIDLSEFSRARNLTPVKIQAAAARLGIADLPLSGKRDMIDRLANEARDRQISPGDFADALAYGLYRDDIERYFPTLPGLLRRQLEESGLIA